MKHIKLTDNELSNSLHAELRKIARSKRYPLRHAQTLQTTEVLNEAWLRLREQEWENRAHLCRTAARAMQGVVIDRARRRSALKRNGVLPDKANPPDVNDILAVQTALAQLSQAHPVAAEVVKRRYFDGHTMAKISEQMGLAPSTVDKKRAFALSWLRRCLDDVQDVASHIR